MKKRDGDARIGTYPASRLTAPAGSAKVQVAFPDLRPLFCQTECPTAVAEKSRFPSKARLYHKLSQLAFAPGCPRTTSTSRTSPLGARHICIAVKPIARSKVRNKRSPRAVLATNIHCVTEVLTLDTFEASIPCPSNPPARPERTTSSSWISNPNPTAARPELWPKWPSQLASPRRTTSTLAQSHMAHDDTDTVGTPAMNLYHQTSRCCRI